MITFPPIEGKLHWTDTVPADPAIAGSPAIVS
jgi:hypothetical protein